MDKIIKQDESAEHRWAMMPAPLRRMPTDVASVVQDHKNQMKAIMGDNEYAEVASKYPPSACVAFYVRQSFDELACTAEELGDQVIGRIMNTTGAGFVWSYEPYDKLTKGKKAAELCLVENYKDGTAPFSVKVTQKAAHPGGGVDVEHHIVCTQFYQRDLAELALLTKTKDQTYSLAIFAEYVFRS